jgi:hypothetical protein
MRDLVTIQRRFYELVTAGEGALAPGFLGTSRRLDVYAEMYVARLHDILADDYPKLRAVLGEDAFRELATDYVRARPPTSFTVRDAGQALPRYLESRNDLPPWSADLAVLERARVEVFDGPDAASLSRDDLATVPLESFPALTLALVPASVVVSVRWSVDDLWSAIEDDVAREAAVPCTRTVLVWRRELRVLHRTLDEDEAELATLLAKRTTMVEVSARLAELNVSQPEQRMVELLARWIDAETLAR